ncbi:fluoride efflux transporter FluC [Rhodoluna lacicola]|uniref:Fluoride-specific ion channel n=1 Tax=Rhodoluna lacicola TaxID=529884 RepID=A0A060JDZ2_9MICO|nr:CrcB family protein [Rhodoluna lacicola]AIC46980.1 CrcB-like protein [Rhodoluna lacicola]
MQINSTTIRLTFLGGALGTLIRFVLFFTFGDLPSIVFVNLAGAALIGWLNGNKKYDTDTLNALWKVGFAGGFTTMSSFAALIVLYTQGIGWVAIVGTLLITGLGLGAYWFAFVISRSKNRLEGDTK